MSKTEGTTTIPYRIDEKFSLNFDELVNIKATNRKSDIGFSEDEKLMISMRDGTAGVGDAHTGAGGTSNQFFFTDFFGNRTHIKGFNNNIRNLIGDTWTDLGFNFTGNNFEFNAMSLPLMTTGILPDVYTTTEDSSGLDRVKIAAGDTTIEPVGQYLFITDDSNNNQAFRGCYASILATEDGEYELNDSGMSGALIAGAKYQIYDTIGEHLQITNGADHEIYVFVNPDGDFIENTYYHGLATINLRNIKALLTDQFVEKQLYYSTSYWIFNKGTLYYSSGNISNPFFYTYDTSFTIPGNNGGDINDIFTFKGRMIVGGSNFIAYFNGLDEITEVSIITNSYGIIARSLVDMGVDAYFITTNKQIYSLSETITGTLKATNIGKVVNSYLKIFNYGVCAGYDGTNLYFYGQSSSDDIGVMIVLDIEYKFWSTYTGLRPSSVVLENGSVYLSDNNSSIIRIFVEGSIKDIGESIEQKVSLKEIDLGDPFSLKILPDLYLWLDNFDQVLTVDTYMSLSKGNRKKLRKKITTIGVDTSGTAPVMGDGILGENILGGFGAEPEATYPFMYHIQYDSDKANIWKTIITGFEGSPFYLNQLDIEIGFLDGKTKGYFNPALTI